MAKPVATARGLLERAGVYNRTADRLAVMLLYSHDIRDKIYGKIEICYGKCYFGCCHQIGMISFCLPALFCHQIGMISFCFLA